MTGWDEADVFYPDTEDRPLKPATKRALDRAAAGIGRTPTQAHPLCICHKPTGRILTRTSLWDYTVTWTEPELGSPEDCPQHRPEEKA